MLFLFYSCLPFHLSRLVYSFYDNTRYTLVPCKYSATCGKIRKMNIEAHETTCEFRPEMCKYCKADIQFHDMEVNPSHFLFSTFPSPHPLPFPLTPPPPHPSPSPSPPPSPSPLPSPPPLIPSPSPSSLSFPLPSPPPFLPHVNFM